jgi:hypothetical protein
MERYTPHFTITKIIWLMLLKEIPYESNKYKVER